MNNSSLLTANLGLPESTRVKRPLPKAQLFKRFDWTPSQRERFDGEVSRLDFVNWISPRTVPAIAVGNEVKEIFVVEVQLKRRCFDVKSIELLAKAIPQCIVYLLRYEDEAMLAVFYSKLYTTLWQHAKGMSLQVCGINLDMVWEGFVRQIVGTSLCDVADGNGDIQHDIQHAKGMSLRDEIRVGEERAKLERQIAALERQMNATKQPRRKRELFEQLQKLKKCYNG